MRTRFLGNAVCAFLLLSGSARLHAETYTLIDLGTLGGSLSTSAGINASGQVAGYANPVGDPPVRPTLFSGTGTGNKDLGTLGGTNGRATGINDGGHVVGYSELTAVGPTHAVLFSGTGTQNKDLGTLGGSVSFAYQINASGQIVGNASLTGDAVTHATLFSGTGSGNKDLGNLDDVESSQSIGHAINAAGQCVGRSYIAAANETHATRFSGTGTGNKDLGTLGGKVSYAFGINASGKIVGQASLAGDASQHAVLFSGTGTGNTDLQTLGGTNSVANAINASGQIVGNSFTTGNATIHGFFIDGGPMVDLNTLIAPGSGWEITDAVGINDAGQIAAVGKLNGAARHALLLTPVAGPTPSPSPNPPKKVSAPVIKPAGKKKVTTTKAKLLIKGTATGVVTSVTYRVGSKGAYKAARGTSPWKFKAKLKPGKNVVSVIAHGPGGDSAPAKLKVIRQ